MAREGCGGRFLSFLLGAVAGAAAAILLTPRSGRETREYIAERGNEVGESVARRAHDLATDVQSRTGTWLDRGRDLLDAETRRLRDAFDAGREAMRDEIQRGGEAPSGVDPRPSPVRPRVALGLHAGDVRRVAASAEVRLATGHGGRAGVDPRDPLQAGRTSDTPPRPAAAVAGLTSAFCHVRSAEAGARPQAQRERGEPQRLLQAPGVVAPPSHPAGSLAERGRGRASWRDARCEWPGRVRRAPPPARPRTRWDGRGWCGRSPPGSPPGSAPRRTRG